MKSKTTKEARDLKAFKASLAEGVKYARGQKAKVKVEALFVRTTPKDVKEARKALHVSQPQFAQLMQVSSESVKKWEQGVNPIPGGISQWVQAALRKPKLVRELLTY